MRFYIQRFVLVRRQTVSFPLRQGEGQGTQGHQSQGGQETLDHQGGQEALDH